ncbi:hypothetical protein BT69DRAFT_1280964 [Atractiella rhizophila]|nr:hypothetical protein BT69DRAFT_1280964 [Atractiella rhizophila]
MPALTLHLLTHKPSSTPNSVLLLVQTLLPTSLPFPLPLPSHFPSILLLLPSPPQSNTSQLPPEILEKADVYTLPIGVPKNLVQEYETTSERLRNEAKGVPLTGSLEKFLAMLKQKKGGEGEGQSLELSKELLEKGEALQNRYDGPVTMFNLMRFQEGEWARESYHKYGKEFAMVGGKRGGQAKILGSVLGRKDGWDEVSIVHYPSINHFMDMLCGEDYQEINRKHRLGALEDTLLYCSIEVDLLEKKPKL